MKKNLDQKIRRYKAMEKHRMMVRKGQLKAAKLMLRLLRTGSVSLGLDDDSWTVEIACEELGCRLFYDSRGNRVTAYL